MSFRIGLISISGSASTADAVRACLPADASLHVHSVADATRLVAEGALSVLIVAMDGPDWRADLSAMTDLHAVGEKRPLAVVALVPRDDPDALAMAFDYNVADVAGLPVVPGELRPRLAALLRRRMVAMARVAESRAVWQLATVDQVTGLHNRHFLQSVLPEAIDSARRCDRPLSFLMIDLDALKPFNDRWGHALGDRALHCAAQAIRAHARPCDTVARYGGDEMAVVMPDTDLETARDVALAMAQAVAAARVDGAPGVSGPTVSIGVAMLQAGDSSESLVARADSALYRAKKDGRNRISEAA